jgi:hypothetical protein
MSIIKAIERAYQIKEERNWDTIYWAIDLHGTCLKSNYVLDSYEWINEDARICMEYIMHLHESKVIIWTSTHYSEKELVKDLLEEAGWINYWNCNPEVKNTETGCFDEKFYFSILLDDKAGFDPDIDWKLIYEYLKNK